MRIWKQSEVLGLSCSLRCSGYPCANPPPYSPTSVPGWTRVSSSNSDTSSWDCPAESPMAGPSLQLLSICPSVCSVCSPRGSSVCSLCCARGSCSWHLLLPLPGTPSSQTTGWTGLGAESASPVNLASPGRGLKRTYSCKTSLDYPPTHQERLTREGLRKEAGQPQDPGCPRDNPAKSTPWISLSKQSPM